MPHDDDEQELQPTFHPGFKLGEQKTVEELANLDKEDESLAKWKASLGIGPGGSAMVAPTGPKITVINLTLTSGDPSLPQPIVLDPQNPQPIKIKEGAHYSVNIHFRVNHGIVSGLRYLHIVKRVGVVVDKMEQMLGSYAPSPDGNAYSKTFPEEEAPSGMLARGKYTVRSRVMDDDGKVPYVDFTWSFEISKEW